MGPAAHVVLWIATIAGGLGALGGLVLAYMCLRWARSGSDKRTGVYLGLFALAQNGIPYWGFHLAAGGHATGAFFVGLVWTLVSLVFLALWPGLVSAAGQ